MRRLATIQGWYYALTGIWPLVNRRSFEAVTGPKTDWWLVQAVAVLVCAIGACLLRAGREPAVPVSVRVLAVGSAVGLAVLELVHVAQGHIRAVYGADALLELAFAAAWCWSRPRMK